MENNAQISLERHQALIFEVMKDIDRFCRANDIRYSLSSGTLLGAVRHGGFIPWDDDADIFMLREDFDRFVKTYKSDKYELIYGVDKNDGYFISGYAKVNDPSGVQKRNGRLKHPAIYVDIFPLDSVPEEPKAQHKYMHKLMRIHNRLHHRNKHDFVSIIKSYWRSRRGWWNKLDRTVHSGKYDDSPLVAHAVGTRNYRTVIRRDRFDSLVDTPFRDYKFLGFKDTDGYLSKVYGPDYMTPKKWSHNLKVYVNAE